MSEENTFSSTSSPTTNSTTFSVGDSSNYSITLKEYFDSLVGINIDNLKKYYELVKEQTNKSFYTAIGAGIAGFVLIIIGLVIMFFYENKRDIVYLTSTSGILTEFISGIFFYLYSRTVRQMKEYHDSLLELQNVLLCFTMLKDHKKEEDKIEIMKQLISSVIKNNNNSKELTKKSSIK